MASLYPGAPTAVTRSATETPLYPGAPSAVTASAHATPRSVATQTPPSSTPPKKTTTKTKTKTTTAATVPYTDYLTPAQRVAQATADAKAQQAAASQGLDTTSKENQQSAAAQQQTALATGQALAGILKGVGPQIADMYGQSADADAAYAKGFSTALSHIQGQTSDQAASILNLTGGQAQLPGINAQIGGADVTDPLYRLYGQMPASDLRAEGAAFGSAAANLPAQALGVAQQQQQLTRNQLATAQQKVADAREKLAAGLPGLIDTSLGRINTEQGRLASAAATADYRAQTLQAKAHTINLPLSKQLGQLTYNDNTPVLDVKGNTVPWRDTSATALKPSVDKYGRLYQIGADGVPHYMTSGLYHDPNGTTYTVGLDGKFTVFSTKPAAVVKPTAVKTTTASDAKGTYLVNAETGARIATIAGPKATAAAAKGGATVIGSASTGYAYQYPPSAKYPNGRTVPFPGRWGRPSATASGGTSAKAQRAAFVKALSIGSKFLGHKGQKSVQTAAGTVTEPVTQNIVHYDTALAAMENYWRDSMPGWTGAQVTAEAKRTLASIPGYFTVLRQNGLPAPVN